MIMPSSVIVVFLYHHAYNYIFSAHGDWIKKSQNNNKPEQTYKKQQQNPQTR